MSDPAGQISYRSEKTQRCALKGCTLLFAICLGGALALSAGHVRAAELTNDTIKEKQAQIEEAKEEQETIRDSITDVEAVKEQLATRASFGWDFAYRMQPLE